MPQTTTSAASTSRIAGLVLAAGRSTRMGTINKLLVEMNGVPLVTCIIKALLTSQAGAIIVVTGHQHEQVEQALSGYDVICVYNPNYRQGISTSLRRGLNAVPANSDGVLICLGDMPRISAAHIDHLIDAFDPDNGRAICVPKASGSRGNPVLWARRFFPEIRRLTGDVGARDLITTHAGLVCEVPLADKGTLIDVDTPEDLAALRAE
ncbi:MAG: nucleotidyltransferase family protein [Gammaproteobacteria bacterium]|jgi:molybdenum cofactor cytidylyltransferase|nr:nucleotidyltransferase family protein [Gammaproteobacteria bacterium]